jgi:hypothetical protein
VKLNEQTEEDETELRVLVVEELVWLALLSSLSSAKLEKLKLKLLNSSALLLLLNVKDSRRYG